MFHSRKCLVWHINAVTDSVHSSFDLMKYRYEEDRAVSLNGTIIGTFAYEEDIHVAILLGNPPSGDVLNSRQYINDESLVGYFGPLASSISYFGLAASMGMRLNKGSITSSSGGMSIDLRVSEAAKAVSDYKCMFAGVGIAQATAIGVIVIGY
uniref:Dirigent protein n=1 Tax=Loa loa TaxID=7209 RepID=A0A1I7VFQ9_LOALO